jgi:hypothetical protein
MSQSTSIHVSINFNSHLNQLQFMSQSTSIHVSINLNSCLNQPQLKPQSTPIHVSINLNWSLNQLQLMVQSTLINGSTGPSQSKFDSRPQSTSQSCSGKWISLWYFTLALNECCSFYIQVFKVGKLHRFCKIYWGFIGCNHSNPDWAFDDHIWVWEVGRFCQFYTVLDGLSRFWGSNLHQPTWGICWYNI